MDNTQAEPALQELCHYSAPTQPQEQTPAASTAWWEGLFLQKVFPDPKLSLLLPFCVPWLLTCTTSKDRLFLDPIPHEDLHWGCSSPLCPSAPAHRTGAQVLSVEGRNHGLHCPHLCNGYIPPLRMRKVNHLPCLADQGLKKAGASVLMSQAGSRAGGQATITHQPLPWQSLTSRSKDLDWACRVPHQDARVPCPAGVPARPAYPFPALCIQNLQKEKTQSTWLRRRATKPWGSGMDSSSWP